MDPLRILMVMFTKPFKLELRHGWQKISEPQILMMEQLYHTTYHMKLVIAV